MAAPLERRRPLQRIRVLEVGAGTGVFTREILRRLRGGDRLDIYEINPQFCECLERLLGGANWRQRNFEVALHGADIRTLPAGERFDFIVCGLPLNNFAPGVVAEILDLLLDRLSGQGVFSYFEYLGLRHLREWFLRSGPERERLQAISAIMGEVLERHQIRADEVWLNFPPAAAHHLTRQPA